MRRNHRSPSGGRIGLGAFAVATAVVLSIVVVRPFAAETRPATLPAGPPAVLRDMPEKKWQEMAFNLYAGPKALGCDFYVFPDNTRIVYTTKQGGRRVALHFIDLAKRESSHVPLLTEPGDERLTIGEFRITPDSREIWVMINVQGVSGSGSWFRYVVETQTLNKDDKVYRWLRQQTQETVKPAPVWGPVWSLPDCKFYADRIKAEKAGVKRFWHPVPFRQRHSQVRCGATALEMITGGYQKGHLFTKGRYVTSVPVASAWVPQNCWFLRERDGVVVYKFYRHGKRGAGRSLLKGRTILCVWDVPDTGVVVYSWDSDKEYIDLIPPKPPVQVESNK